MSTRLRFTLLVLLLAAIFLRANGLFANAFHADEALFASWARLIGVWADPLLTTQAVDKPPLFFYLQAWFFPLFGPVEWAARMPSLVASLLLIPLSAQLALSLFRDDVVAVLTAAFATFSPLLIQFSATAFIDPLMGTLLLASAWMAVRNGRLVASKSAVPADSNKRDESMLSGVMLGLALANKYQALLFIPLLLGLASVQGWRRRQYGRWLLGFLTVVATILLWDLVRSGTFTLWTQQMTSFGGVRLAWSWELWPRLEGWAEQWGYLMPSPVVGFGLLLGLPPFLALLIADEDRTTILDRLLVVFVVGYFALHWLLAIPIWERYVVPVAPIVGLLVARYALRLWRFAQSQFVAPSVADRWADLIFWLVPAALLVLQLDSVAAARSGRLLVGGFPSADEGAAHVAAALADAAYGTVLYDHWYSWQWRYHLFDSKVYVNWFPDPSQLREDLAVFGDQGPGRYVIVKAGPQALPVLRAIDEAGFMRVLVAGSTVGDGMRLYLVKRDAR